MTEEPKFQVGDRVRWCGVDGTVTVIHDTVRVTFDISNNVSYEWEFLPDGRFLRWHTEPSLILVERPRKKVKRWVNLYRGREDYVYGFLHESEESSEENININRDYLASVEISVYEVEE